MEPHTTPVTPVSPEQASVTSPGVPTPAPIITPPPAPEPKKGNSWGAIISIVILLALVVFGALYVWGQRISDEGTQVNVTETAP
jgi:uncharacterized protein HemX